MKPSSTLILVLILFAFVSCSKASAPVAETKAKVDVAFCLSTETKSVMGALGEISSLDVLVFRKNGGALEAYARSDEDSVSTVVSRDIQYDYYVVANAPAGSLSTLSYEDQFLQKVWMLSDMSGGITMIGSGDHTFTDSGVISVSLDRLLSKVTLAGITPSFLENTFTESVVKLERIFLINVDGSCYYRGVPYVGSVWYNKLCLESLSPSISEKLIKTVDRIIIGPETIKDTMSFFCCPNPTDNGINSTTQPTWSVRNTRLVIELSIDGVSNYYPIDMPSMECNRNYVVKNAVLIGPGSSNPDIPVSRSSLSFVITVNPWEKDTGKTINF